MGDSQILSALYSCLGNRAILLPIPFGEKGPKGKGWPATTFERTQEPDYQEELAKAEARKGNIGVLLTSGLVSVDVDDDALADSFAARAHFSTTMRTRGERGCNFWFRIIGDYPNGQSVYKLKADGKEIGGWRCGPGAQTMVWGQHPSSTPEKPIRYKSIAGKRAVEVRFDELSWPPEISLPWEKKQKAPEKQSSVSSPDANLDKRIMAYLAAIPPAVSKQNGHGQTYSVARELYNGWGLSVDESRPYLKIYSQRCEPPWTDQELEHKLADAEKAAYDKPRGHLRGQDKPKADLAGADRDNSCPYPPVDWSQAKNVENARFTHEAIYPADSILHPFTEIGKTICEGADCYLLGSILPVISAMTKRRIFLQWGAGRIYPNIFSLLVGKAGDRKSSTIQIASRVAAECLPANAFLPHSFSPESLFDEYFDNPDKFWMVDDANPVLNDWKLSGNGERVAARFLPLYDCGRLTESFRRNKSDTAPARREVSETSTSVLFGATFNVAAFQGQQIRAGLARRFLYYIADTHGRIIVRPVKVDLSPLVDLFKSILLLEGEIDFSTKALELWDTYQRKNRETLAATDILNESLCSRLSSAPTHVQKIAMLFEACRCVAGRPKKRKRY
jgi:hypothetical protein